jgi:hypothetical protein
MNGKNLFSSLQDDNDEAQNPDVAAMDQKKGGKT